MATQRETKAPGTVVLERSAHRIFGTGMTISRYASIAVAMLALAGCGSSEKEQQAASYCPQPLTVQDALRITRFKDGPGRDPRDVMFEAQLLNAGTQCKLGRN